MSQRELVKSQNTPTGRRQDPVIISCAPGVLCTAVIASEAHPGPREGSPFLHLQVNAPCARLNTFTNRPKARPTAAPLRVGNFLHGGSAACHLVSCASAWPWSCRASGYRLNIGVPMGVTVQINGLESPASVRPDFLACTITTDCPDNFDHSLRRKGRKATANMVSQLLARAAVLAATCGFAAAQTTSACDPTKGGACAPDKAFGGSWGYDFSSKSKLPDLKDAWNLDGGVEFADPGDRDAGWQRRDFPHQQAGPGSHDQHHALHVLRQARYRHEAGKGTGHRLQYRSAIGRPGRDRLGKWHACTLDCIVWDM